MLEEVNVHSSVAIYAQIENQIRFAIASGKLKANDQLPSIKELGERLGVNFNTVAKAYRDLEVMGLIYTRRGMGCYVTAIHCEDYMFAGIISNSGGLHHFMIEDPTELKKLRTKRVVIMSSPTDTVQRPEYLAKDRVLLEGAGVRVNLLTFTGGHQLAPPSLYDEALRLLREDD